MPPQSYAPGFFGAASSPVGQGFNPGTLSNILPTIQKAAGVAQTVTPMIKQYYPLVKQLPTIIKLLSSTTSPLKSPSDTTDSKKEVTLDLETSKLMSHEEPATSAYFSDAPPPKLYV